MGMSKIAIRVALFSMPIILCGCRLTDYSHQGQKAILVTSGMEEKECSLSAWRFLFKETPKDGEFRVVSSYQAHYSTNFYHISRTVRIKVGAKVSEVLYEIMIYRDSQNENRNVFEAHTLSRIADTKWLEALLLKYFGNENKTGKEERITLYERCKLSEVYWSYFSEKGFCLGSFLKPVVFDVDCFFSEVCNNVDQKITHEQHGLMGVP